MARLSRNERLALARECAASGMGVREWCAANGVRAPTMYAWMRMRGGRGLPLIASG